jgi:hypothetical protein
MSPRLSLLLLALLAGAPAAAMAQTAAVPIKVDAYPLPLDPRAPKQRRLGQLSYAGGFHLTAKTVPGFGGFSGLDVMPDGRFISQTDTGDLMRGRLVLDRRGRLAGVADTTLAQLVDEAGHTSEVKSDFDAEDISFLDEGGFAISFEQDHRVMVYPGEGPPRRLAPVPDPTMPKNTGLEALTEWHDPSAGGAPQLIEGSEDGRAWSCDLEGRDCRQFLDPAHDTPDKDFSLTGLDALPRDLGMVAIYRAFDTVRGMRGMICWVRPGAPRQVTVLARLADPLTVDNFEGIAAVEEPHGLIRLYIISDDNVSNLQRTLLMAFDWKPEEPAR